MRQDGSHPLDLVLHTIGNPIRRRMITYLSHSEARFSDLLAACGLDYDHDAGQFCYHLSELIDKHIAEKKDDLYCLSGFGAKVAQMLNFLESESSYLFKERPREARERMDEKDLEVKWIGSKEEFRVDRDTGKGNLSVGFNTRPESLYQRMVDKLPDGPEKKRLLRFMDETGKWDGPQRVLTMDNDLPLGWAIVGSGVSWGDKPVKESEKPEVSVTTSLTLDYIAAWSVTPWTEAHRKKVILCLANSVLKKGQDIKADQIKVRGVHSEDSTLVGVLKELGFTRTATNYDMEKNLRLPEESRS